MQILLQVLTKDLKTEEIAAGTLIDAVQPEEGEALFADLVFSPESAEATKPTPEGVLPEVDLGANPKQERSGLAEEASAKQDITAKETRNVVAVAQPNVPVVEQLENQNTRPFLSAESIAQDAKEVAPAPKELGAKTILVSQIPPAIPGTKSDQSGVAALGKVSSLVGPAAESSAANRVEGSVSPKYTERPAASLASAKEAATPVSAAEQVRPVVAKAPVPLQGTGEAAEGPVKAQPVLPDTPKPATLDVSAKTITEAPHPVKTAAPNTASKVAAQPAEAQVPPKSAIAPAPPEAERPARQEASAIPQRQTQIQPLSYAPLPLRLDPQKSLPPGRGETAPLVRVSVPAPVANPPDKLRPVQPLGLATSELPLKEVFAGRDVPFAKEDVLPPLLASEATEARRSAESPVPRLEAPARPVLTQLVQAAKSAIDGMVEVKLSPEELGRVRLAMTTVESGMTVLVTAERAETLDLIRRNIDLFAADLAEQGFTNLNFSFGGETSDGDGEQSDDPSERAIRPDLRPVFDGRIDPAVTASNGRVDLRI